MTYRTSQPLHPTEDGKPKKIARKAKKRIITGGALPASENPTKRENRRAVRKNRKDDRAIARQSRKDSKDRIITSGALPASDNPTRKENRRAVRKNQRR